MLLLLMNISLFAQKKKKSEEPLLNENAEWFEGSILLNDGTPLEGLLKYNAVSAILSFQDGTVSKVFTSSRVSTFQFFDESLQKQRVFYALPHEDAETNAVRPLFFEALREYQSFAVLSKVDPVDVDRRVSKNPFVYTSPDGSGIMNSTNLVVSQIETIYLMNASGEIRSYFKIVREEKSGMWSLDKTSNKMIERDLLLEFIPQETFDKLERFAKENDLKFKLKDDFLKILTYYDTLID